MKSNREWFNLLTEKEQEQFKRNCDEYGGYTNFEGYIGMKSVDFYNFIGGAFIWLETDEKTKGHKYWSKIANSNRTIKD